MEEATNLLLRDQCCHLQVVCNVLFTITKLPFAQASGQGLAGAEHTGKVHLHCRLLPQCKLLGAFECPLMVRYVIECELCFSIVLDASIHSYALLPGSPPRRHNSRRQQSREISICESDDSMGSSLPAISPK